MIRIFNKYVSTKSLFLVVLEAAVISLSFMAAVKLRFWSDPTELASYMVLPDFAVQIAIVVAVCIACLYFNDLYDLSSGSGYRQVEWALRIEQSLGAACLLLGLLYFPLSMAAVISRRVYYRHDVGHCVNSSDADGAGQGLAGDGSRAACTDSGDRSPSYGCSEGTHAARRSEY